MKSDAARDKLRHDAIHGFFERCLTKRGKTLVLGSKVYDQKVDRRRLFEDAVGLDMLPGDGVDIVHDLERPIDIGPFDHIDCVSVLEHVRRPWLFAENAERLLVHDGTIFISMPWVWRLHGYPNDYWRMTPEAVRSLFPGIDWLSTAYINDTKVMKRPLAKADDDGVVWFARSELVMFGRRCAF